VTTVEDPEWSRRYLSADLAEKAFGGRVEIVLRDGSTIVEEIALPDAHPLGARPYGREQYVEKFRGLADVALEKEEIDRFLDVVQRLPDLTAPELSGLTITARPGYFDLVNVSDGIF
jgi:2-methylcitrate dehydratase